MEKRGFEDSAQGFGGQERGCGAQTCGCDGQKLREIERIIAIWAEIALDGEQKPADRLKASQLWAQALGLFDAGAAQKIESAWFKE